MASITRQSSGNRLIQFTGQDGQRKTVRLGKVPQRAAETVKLRIEHLIAAATTGSPLEDETARWVAELDADLYDKLAAVDLVPRRDCTRLKPFLDTYITSRCDAKPNTHLNYNNARRNLVEYFGEAKPLREITPGCVDEWRLAMVKKGLADNTIRRRCGIAKQFFKAAVRKKLVPENPFIDQKVHIVANTSRMYFVSRKETQRVLDACPDAQWRLLFALGRYGGLRCPSEHLGLRWIDVDWAGSKLRVRSPKTEHHAGGESRMVPLFPELLPYLREVFEQAEDCAEFVITRYRDTTCNLRTQLLRIIDKASLKPWPKLWQNLRSTRETELAETYPLHVVCAWIGNSQVVAARHYLQVTEEHFQRGAGTTTPVAAIATEGNGAGATKPSGDLQATVSGSVNDTGADGDNSALQNALQQAVVSPRTASHGRLDDSGPGTTCLGIPKNAAPCENTGPHPMGQRGVEHPSRRSKKTAESRKRAAECAATPSEPSNSLDLALVDALLSQLPAKQKQLILKRLVEDR